MLHWCPGLPFLGSEQFRSKQLDSGRRQNPCKKISSHSFLLLFTSLLCCLYSGSSSFLHITNRLLWRGLSCMYLAHHELESFLMILVNNMYSALQCINLHHLAPIQVNGLILHETVSQFASAVCLWPVIYWLSTSHLHPSHSLHVFGPCEASIQVAMDRQHLEVADRCRQRESGMA